MNDVVVMNLHSVWLEKYTCRVAFGVIRLQLTLPGPFSTHN
jgi:hypothetical protein